MPDVAYYDTIWYESMQKISFKTVLNARFRSGILLAAYSGQMKEAYR